MKLWKGKKRLAKKINPDVFEFEKAYEHMASLKPGDLYGGCDGFNHRLKESNIIYCSHGKTKVACTIELYGKDSSIHCFPNCAWPAQPKEQIIKEWLQLTESESKIKCAKEWGWFNFITKLSNGEELLDSDGVLLDPNWRDN